MPLQLVKIRHKLLVVTIHGTILYFSRIYQNLLRLVKQDPASLVHKVALGRIENKGLSELVENFLGLSNTHA